ncbi:MAG: cation diffusion facilitator family transporter, partial [Solirubrobacterales bacterium]
AHGFGQREAALDARRSDSRRRMWIALTINLGLLAAGVVGGILTGSLALLADAGHVLSDVGAIALGLLAVALAMRATGPRRTFGLQRTEVLAALANGLTLVVVAVLIVVAAIDRLGDAPEIDGAGVLILGVVGLIGNLVATVVLAGGERDDINLEGVLRHSAADALGSIGVVVSGAVFLATGWAPIDPIASLAIAALILISSWRLIAEPFDVLMESAPAGVDVAELGRFMCEVEDVREVHELHVWTVTAGFDALAAHVVVARGADRDLAQRRLQLLLRDRYGLEHTTLQMEERADPELLNIDLPGRDA